MGSTKRTFYSEGANFMVGVRSATEASVDDYVA